MSLVTDQQARFKGGLTTRKFGHTALTEIVYSQILPAAYFRFVMFYVWGDEGTEGKGPTITAPSLQPSSSVPPPF